MGLRGTSSINVVRLNSSNAPDGIATFTITYVSYDVNGRPKYVDPTKIEVQVYHAHPEMLRSGHTRGLTPITRPWKCAGCGRGTTRHLSRLGRARGKVEDEGDNQ